MGLSFLNASNIDAFGNKIRRLLASIGKQTAHNSARVRKNTDHIEKHHWFAGSMIIIFGSWITHTTTATIEDHEPLFEKSNISQQTLGFYPTGSDSELSPTDFATTDIANSDLAATEFSAKGLSTKSASLIDASATDLSTKELSASEFANLVPTAASSPAIDSTAPDTLLASRILIDNQTPAGVVKPAPAVKKDQVREKLHTRTHTIRKGESLGSIFRKQKLDLAIPHHVSRHEIASSLVDLSIGRTLTFKLSEDKKLRQIRYPVSRLRELIVDIDGVHVKHAQVSDMPYTMAQYRISGEINSSMYQSARDAGLSISLVMEMVRIFGWDIDFVQDIRNGDQFHVVYEDYMLNDEKLADGHILAAEFTAQGQTYRAIRFQDEDGSYSYYAPNGDSMLGTFLRSPVEFSRISSRFGKRKHPISKRWKAHKGVDYAASRGTPVRATADGKITHVGRKGGYGKTIILRHAGRFTTLYAHMNGYAKGMRSGQRVKQGQTIGYVGSTGYSTGPHLHYEFRFDGVHRNPLTYKTPKASSIDAKQKGRFLEVAGEWENELDKLQKYHLLAKAASGKTKL